MVFISMATVHAQDFKIEVNGALPIGDIGDSYSFGASAGFSYLFEVSDTFQAGPTTGVIHYFGSSEDITIAGVTATIDFEDTTFIPLGGTARLLLGDAFMIGADLGYGIGVSPSGNDGGFYYKPKVGYTITDSIAIVAGYSGVSVDGGTFSSINAGIEFGL